MKSSLVAQEFIEKKIYIIRGQKVMLDSDLARLYGVETKALNQAVKRNKERFPEEFMFRLTKIEKDEVVTNCDHLKKLKFSPQLPYAFTEYGALMLANVIKSITAIKIGIAIVKAFVRRRGIAITNIDIKKKVEDMEKKYDHQFKAIFDVIKHLLEPIESDNKRKIGFHGKIV